MVKDCPVCEGEGTVNLYRNQSEDQIGYKPIECDTCWGTGKVPTEDDDYASILELVADLKDD